MGDDMWECNTGVECVDCIGGCDANLEFACDGCDECSADKDCDLNMRLTVSNEQNN